MFKTSVVIPCFNDANVLHRNLPFLIKKLDSMSFSYEIIIADDGSSEGESIKKIAENAGCRFVALPQNLGKGAAVREGMLAANGEFRIFMDADIPFELDALDKFLHYLDFKEFDLVVGDRTLPESSYLNEIPRIRKVGSYIFSFISGRFVAGGYFDTQCGMKGFRAETAKDLFSVARVNRFGFDVELLYIALKRNYDIKKLPVVLRCQEGSSVKIIRDGIGMVYDLFRVIVYQLIGAYEIKK